MTDQEGLQLKGSSNLAFHSSVDEIPKLSMNSSPKSHTTGGFSGEVDTEPITYSWKNINVWVGPERPANDNQGGDEEKGGCCRRKSKKSSKQILKNVTGVVRPSELVAIMGASGAGKTSLLNVLTFRNTRDLRITGERCVNGVPLNRKMLSSISAYVQQDDLFIGTMTVREHLIFQARLRMHSHIPFHQRMKRVEEVILDLGLTKCADTLIGVPGRIKGISGGEMKRLSFASEVLTDPPLLFCDEPTSGLDSYMAQNVVSVLKELANKGKTIVCTIHQPSSQVYSMFDRILLMAEGRPAYLGDAAAAVDFFDRLGYTCPANFNPSDFFIQTLAIQPGNVEVCQQKVADICDNYENSDAAKDVARITREAQRRNSILSRLDKSNTDRSPYKASWCTQFLAVIGRSWSTQIKDPMLFRVRFGTTIFIAVLFGIIYLQQDNDQEGIMNINGALFLFITNMTFQNVFAVTNVFCAELPIFLREHLNGMYRTDVYFLGKTIAELPVYIIMPLMFTSITYWMIGLNSDPTRFLITCVIITLLVNTAVSFGYFVSCISPNLNVALAITPVAIIPFLIFGGFFLNNGSVPDYFIWLKYISWFLYANEALAVNQWKGVENIKCNRVDTSTCTTSGAQVLRNSSFNENHLVLDICILGALLVSFRVLAFLALLRKSYRR